MFLALYLNRFDSFKHFNILSSSPRCANFFKAAPLVAFRRTNNLSDLLVSAKLRNPTQNNLPHGSFRCGDNCLTCNYITDGRTSYTFHSTGETRHITHHIDCNSKNVITRDALKGHIVSKNGSISFLRGMP